MNLLFKITYGLYVLTSEADGKAGGCVINTLSQQTSEPERFSVTVNKLNFTHDLIMRTSSRESRPSPRRTAARCPPRAS